MTNSVDVSFLLFGTSDAISVFVRFSENRDVRLNSKFTAYYDKLWLMSSAGILMPPKK